MRDRRFCSAKKWIYQAGTLLRKCHIVSAAASKTNHQDLVSEYDKQIETFFLEKIKKQFQNDSVMGEEGEKNSGGECVWYIDPIDGTTNFISQKKHYAVSVACYQKGQPLFGLVYDVESRELFSAIMGQGAYRNKTRIHCKKKEIPLQDALFYTPFLQHTFLQEGTFLKANLRLAKETRGIRSLGCVALELCALAAGECDGFIAVQSSPWDHNSAKIILHEAGGAIGSFTQKELPQNESTSVLACCNQTLFSTVQTIFLEEAHAPVCGN